MLPEDLERGQEVLKRYRARCAELKAEGQVHSRPQATALLLAVCCCAIASLLAASITTNFHQEPLPWQPALSADPLSDVLLLQLHLCISSGLHVMGICGILSL